MMPTHMLGSMQMVAPMVMTQGPAQMQGRIVFLVRACDARGNARNARGRQRRARVRQRGVRQGAQCWSIARRRRRRKVYPGANAVNEEDPER